MNLLLSLYGLLQSTIAKIPARTWGIIIGIVVAFLCGMWTQSKLHHCQVIKPGVIRVDTVLVPHAAEVAVSPDVIAKATLRPVILYVTKKVHDTALLHDTSVVYATIAIPETLQTHCLSVSKKFPRGDSVYAEICSQLLPMTIPADFRGTVFLQRAPDTCHNTFRMDTVMQRPTLWYEAKRSARDAVIGAIIAEIARAIITKKP